MATRKLTNRSLRTRKSMYKTGILIAVATVFIVVNVFIRSPHTSKKVLKLNQNYSFVDSLPNSNTEGRMGRKILGLEPELLRWEAYDNDEVSKITA